MVLRCCLLLLASFAAGTAYAVTTSPFDLAGPTLEVKITRGGVSLPASQVPNLAAGDQLWIKADLPPPLNTHPSRPPATGKFGKRERSRTALDCPVIVMKALVAGLSYLFNFY